MCMFNNECTEGEYYAEKGIIYILPYTNPWSWMNKATVKFVDEIIDIIFKKYHLSETTPIVSSGGSMGGQQALVYMAYAKKTPRAAVVNCPVCDMVYHFNERKDLPRTIYSALITENTSFNKALKSISPLHLISKLPKDSAYHIFHCDQDKDVNKVIHSDALVSKMKEKDMKVTYDIAHNKGHCDLPYQEKVKYGQYICNEILNSH